MNLKNLIYRCILFVIYLVISITCVIKLDMYKMLLSDRTVD